MLYFDTSFLAPLVLPEATSDRVAKFISRLPVAKLTSSHWARVEFSSLLAREVRMDSLRPEIASEADVRFERLLEDSFLVLLPNVEDFNRAKEFLGNHKSGLRAGDALHLAIARNHRAEVIYSLDKTMVKAGKGLGLPLSTGIRPPGYAD
jgi:predicted nucleic acid-binding protein